MSVPGFQDPAVASLAPAGNLYYQADASQAVKVPSQEVIAGGGTMGQSVDAGAPSLMFGGPEKFTGQGEAIVTAASQAATGGRGSVKEILNFHGSPAPWILIGILLVAGILHLSAEGKFGAGV